MIFFYSSSSIAQEDEGLKIRNSYEETNSGPPTFFTSILESGVNDNVFKTPKGSYLDPETGKLISNSNVSSLFIKPVLNFKLMPYNKNKEKWVLSFKYIGIFHTGDSNVENANGFDGKVATDYTIKKNYKEDKYHKFKIGTFLGTHRFNYLNRGNGELRKFSDGTVDAKFRYAYKTVGINTSYTYEMKKKTKLFFNLGYYERDYDEVSGEGSFDRDVYSIKLGGVYQFRDKWKLFFHDKYTQKKYKTHLANASSGDSVEDTLREYLENEYKVIVKWKSNKENILFGYRSFSRNDTFAHYWSYKESTIIIEGRSFFENHYQFGLSYNYTDREYELETNPDGVIRDRQVSDFGAELVRKRTWGEIHLKFNHKDQNDKDPYLVYGRNLFSVMFVVAM